MNLLQFIFHKLLNNTVIFLSGGMAVVGKAGAYVQSVLAVSLTQFEDPAGIADCKAVTKCKSSRYGGKRTSDLVSLMALRLPLWMV